MCEGTEAGLKAVYLNGTIAFEGPINNGYGTDCPVDPYNHNLYQDVCTLLTNSPVNWAWGNSFSVSWTGYIYAPVTGSYTFGGWVDGSVYIQIQSQIIANFNTTGGSYSGSITLEGGRCVPITMSFTANGGSNNMVLNWRPPGASVSELVPRAYLRHRAGQ